MLRVSEQQEAALQEQLDEPLVSEICERLGADAASVGISPDGLRSRAAAGLGLARRLDARDGFERNAVVAMAVFLDPAFHLQDGLRPVMEDRRMSLEAKLRFLTTRLLAAPPQEG